MYKLTKEGRRKCNAFIKDCRKRREELLKDCEDKDYDETKIPNINDILSDVNFNHFTDDKEYINCWGITDDVDSEPLSLKMGTDLMYHHQIIRYTTELDKKGRVVLKEECIVPFISKYEQIATPKDLAKMLNECFGLNKKTEERMYLVCFSTKGHLLGVFEVAVGTVGSACSSPRDFFMKVFALNAPSIVVCHNHPSGDVRGSKQDDEFYVSLNNLCKLLCVNLMDFIIVGDNKVNSYASNGVFKVE